MSVLRFPILFFFTLLFLSENAVCQSGNLGLTFANTGFVTTGINDFYSAGWSVKLQTDGKIVVGGIGSSNGTTGNFSLIRYNSNGFIDDSFGDNGIVSTAIGTDNEGRSLAIQEDGKILLGGFSALLTYDFSIARYKINGTPDSTFGTNGIVTADIQNSNNFGNCIAIQTDGKILQAGMVSDNGVEFDYAVVRYNFGGSLDNTFGTGGIVTTDVGGSNDEAYSLTIQNDGKIIVAGGSKSTSEDDFALVRYNNDGSLDNTFGNGGKVVTDLLANDYGSAVTLDTDGKIYLVGYAGNPDTGKDVGIVSYNDDGSLNAGFGNNGIVIHDFSGTDEEALSVIVNNQGKIIVAGGTTNPSGDNIFILSYNPDGTPDTSFGENGKVITDLNSNEVGRSVIIQTDGKIVVSGYSELEFATVRYLGDGSVDISRIEKNLDAFHDRETRVILMRTNKNQLNSEYTITDASGQKVVTGKIDSENTKISTGDFPAGIYFIHVEGYKTKKLVCF